MNFPFIEDFKGKKITIIGDIMLDHYIFGKTNRISPEAPVPIVGVQNEKTTLGGSGNVIKNVSNLGADVDVICIVGDDNPGKEIINKLNIAKISQEFVLKVKGLTTTRKMRIISNNQHVVRVDWDSKIHNIDNEKMFTNIQKSILGSSALLISDYAKGVCTNKIVENSIKYARESNIPIFIDPKGINWSKYSGSDYITPNLKEVKEVLNIPINSEIDIIKSAKKIKNDYNIKCCLITRGSDGMTIVNNSGSKNIKTVAKEVFDVSGAGDTVIACFTLAKICGLSDFKAANFANYAAGIVVGHLGTEPINLSELED